MTKPIRDSKRWNIVLDAALRVFEQKGYERASVVDVAQAAGLAKPTLYHYINSKEELLEAVIHRSHQRLRSQLAGLEPRASALEMVWHVVYRHVMFNIEYRAETAVFLADFRMLNDERRGAILEMLDEYDKNLQSLVETAQERAEVAPSIDSRLAVLSMLGAANFVARWYRPRPNSDPDGIARAFADHAIGGLLGCDRVHPASPAKRHVAPHGAARQLRDLEDASVGDDADPD